MKSGSRKWRAVIIGAIVLTVVSVTSVALATTGPAAAPTSPYLAFSVNWGSLGSSSFDRNDTLITSVYTATGFALVMSGSSTLGNGEVDVAPQTGTRFVTNMSYSAEYGATPRSDSATLDISANGVTCSSSESGTLMVEQATYSTDGILTAFAASWSIVCFGSGTVTGEIRYFSPVGYGIADNQTRTLAFGNRTIGAATTTMTATAVVRGSESTTFGAASIGPAGHGEFTISSNTCTGNTLTYGQTCTIGISAAANTPGLLSTVLSVNDNSTGGSVAWALTMTGVELRDAMPSVAYIDFGDVPAYDTSAPQTVTFTSSGVGPVTFGTASVEGDGASAYGITSDDCSGTTLAPGHICAVSVVVHPTTTQQFIEASLTLPDNGTAAAVQVGLDAEGFTSDRGTYYPTSPARILDTRSGVGAPRAAISPGGVIHLQVTGRGNVPANAVAAVVLNVTVTGPTAAGFISVYPTGVARPIASSLNFTKGWTGANSVTVAVGTGGKVDLYNATGSTQLIVDVSGYYSSGIQGGDVLGGQLHPAVPTRLADTRTWTPTHTPIPAGHYITVPVSFGATVDPHVKALAVNVTEVNATGTGYFTVWNGYNSTVPSTSTLNYTVGQTVPNFTVVPTSPCIHCEDATGWPSIAVYTTAPANIIVDVVGYYDDSMVPNGMRFRPVVPLRIADSRYRQGLSSAIGPGATATITAPSSVVGNDTAALAMNVTAVTPTTNTFLTVWPAGVSGLGRPTVSNLNPSAGTTVPNAVQTLIGPASAFNVYNSAGSVNLIADVVGTFYVYPGTATAPTTAQAYRPKDGSGRSALVRAPQ